MKDRLARKEMDCTHRSLCPPGFGGCNCEFGIRTLFVDHEVFSSEGKGLKRKKSKVPGWDGGYSWDVLDYLKLNHLPPQLIIEIGVWKGRSTIKIASWLAEQKMGVVVGVDTWLGAIEFWNRQRTGGKYDPTRDLRLLHGYPTVYADFHKNVEEAGLAKFVIPFPAHSKLAADWFHEHNIKADVIHIDASHEKEDVTADISYWWPNLAPSGILIGDAYTSAWPGVIEAVDSFASSMKLRLFRSGKEGRKWWVQAGVGLESLPCHLAQHDTIAFDGEFGWEMLVGLPYAYFLHQCGKLEASVGCGPVSPFYFFSKNHTDDLECSRTNSRRPQRSWVYSKKKQVGGHPSPLWALPPLKAHYRKQQCSYCPQSDPFVVIFNKYSEEWGKPPVNFFSNELLSNLFGACDFYRIHCFYMRPQGGEFAEDKQTIYFLNDSALILKHKFVTSVHDICLRNKDETMNKVLLTLLSRTSFVATTQGGHVYLSLYSQSPVLVWQMRGHETLAHYKEVSRIFGSDVHVFLPSHRSVKATFILRFKGMLSKLRE